MSGLIAEHQVGTHEDPLAVAMLQLAEFTRERLVLLVEDNEGMRMLFGRLAEGFNCRIDYAMDGEIGLAMALANHYDLVILDITLTDPDFSGIDVFERMRLSPRGDLPPVVFLTGRLDDDQADRIDKIGFAPLIKKPFNPDHRYIKSFLGTFGITELPS